MGKVEKNISLSFSNVLRQKLGARGCLKFKSISDHDHDLLFINLTAVKHKLLLKVSNNWHLVSAFLPHRHIPLKGLFIENIKLARPFF